MGIYAFGLTGVLLAVGYAILPSKIAEISKDQEVRFLFISLDPGGSLGTLGIISLAGLITAAIMQPLSGFVSDKLGGNTKARLPFVLVGGLGVGLLLIAMPFVATFWTILLLFVLIQFFGNLAQGPANALIFDNVVSEKIGRASGILNLLKIAGAGICTMGALVLLGFSSPEASRQWLWVAIIPLAAIVVITAGWTYLTMVSVRVPRARVNFSRILEAEGPKDNRAGRKYLGFIVAVAFMASALAAMGRYSLAYLEDVIGVENPQHEVIPVVLATLAAAVLTTVPSGVLSDKLGKDKMLPIAGILGATGAFLLALATTLEFVIFIGVIVGSALGILLTSVWTLANHLVPKEFVARDLSWINLASVAGGGLVYAAGPFLDYLNGRSEDLGYRMLAVGLAIAFMISTVALYFMAKPLVQRKLSEGNV